MVDSIKTPLDQRHLHVNDNSRHDTFPWNNVPRVYTRPAQRSEVKPRVPGQPFSFNGTSNPSGRQFTNLVSAAILTEYFVASLNCPACKGFTIAGQRVTLEKVVLARNINVLCVLCFYFKISFPAVR